MPNLMQHTYLALIHYPVRKHGSVIASSVTNLDIHDIARVSATYGIGRYYLVHPDESQQWFVRNLMSHWLEGDGRLFKPDRTKALEHVELVPAISDAIHSITAREGQRPVVVATSAQASSKIISIKEIAAEHEKPLLILFGTADGLADDLIESIDYFLERIDAGTGYNHLSVRSAVSIFVDRLYSMRIVRP